MVFRSALSVFALLSTVSTALPTITTEVRSSTPVPVVIWHGLGDRYDAPGLLSLKKDLEERPELDGIFVHIVEIGQDGSTDQRATFFGNANDQIALACSQIASLPEISDPTLNPSGEFDAIGFSQGGQLLRGVVERCGGRGKNGLTVRNLITLGSQHMGISALPPCPPGSSPFSPCRLMHLSLLRTSLYSSYAQSKIVPAQYFRDQSTEGEIEKYWKGNHFLRDINNERDGDKLFIEGSETYGKGEPRNATYKENFERLNRFVMFRFSQDVTVVPPHSAHFTLPHPNATNCPTLPPAHQNLDSESTLLKPCYDTPLPYTSLPLYEQDYIGLRTLDERGRVFKGVCEGVHMEIDEKCWNEVVSWLGESGKEGPREASKSDEGLVFQI